VKQLITFSETESSCFTRKRKFLFSG